MRKYTPKNDVQKKSYFNDRFYVSPQTLKLEVSEDEVYAKDFEVLNSRFSILQSFIELNELVIFIKPEDNVKVLKFLKEELSYDMCMELSAIDYLASKNGFEIFYEMLSMTKHKRLRVKTFIEEKQELNSIYEVFKMANWSEREMYDMYGIKIINHPNMKRILMPDDWYDYPLRKTYPLQGDEVASWYEIDKIFGKEYRDVIGPEQRDSAKIDRYDTSRFARLGHEVPLDTDISDGKEPQETKVAYQEEGGVRFIKKFNEENSKTLEKRK